MHSIFHLYSEERFVQFILMIHVEVAAFGWPIHFMATKRKFGAQETVHAVA